MKVMKDLKEKQRQSVMIPYLAFATVVD